MAITDRAAAALALARATSSSTPSETAHMRRMRAALAREVAGMLGVAPSRVVVSEDPLRGYGGQPGLLISVHDPDDADAVWRFVPETGNTGLGGGAYLLLGECPGCATGDGREVPMASISDLADLGLYLECARPVNPDGPDPDVVGRRPEVPVEFFDDPGHAPGCAMS